MQRAIPFPVCTLPDACPVSLTVAAHGQAITDLQLWQAKQNGTLDRLDNKLDKLRNLLLSGLFSALLAAAGWVVVLLKQ